MAAGAGAGTGGAGPTGAALIVDVQRSVDDGISFQSLFGGNVAAMPTIQPGLSTGYASQPSVPILNYGDLLQFEVVQVGSIVAGQNVLLTLKGHAIVG